MYLKNDSSFQCGLRTKKEVLTINPGDVVSILEQDLISINSFLVEATEEEYYNFKRKSLKDTQPTEKVKEVKVEKVKEVKEVKEVKPTKVEKEIKEIKEVKEDKKDEEIKLDEVKKEVDTPANDELGQLEAQLIELKEKWQTTSRASKKASIQKEIKAVQEKIAKLK